MAGRDKSDGGEAKRKRRLLRTINIIVIAAVIALGVLIGGPWTLNLVDSYQGVVIDRPTDVQSLPGRRGSRQKPVYKLSIGTASGRIEREVTGESWSQFRRGSGIRKSIFNTSPTLVENLEGLEKFREQFGIAKPAETAPIATP